MTSPGPDELAAWLRTPPGRYLLAWEQSRVDQAVADLFGFHAVQLGLPELDALRCNRMPHRWCATDHAGVVGDATGDDTAAPPRCVVSLQCHFDALPFPAHSVDLVVLPHTLEFARDPHQTLREVERVLVPEGRVVIFGFNAASLWGVRQRAGGWVRRLGGRGDTFLPQSGEFIGYWRLRDWLRLLSFEMEGGRFGCYAWPIASPRWLQGDGWMDRTGDRWWPVFGAVYSLVAVKRVRGMRLVGLAKDARRRVAASPAVVANREPAPRRARAVATMEEVDG